MLTVRQQLVWQLIDADPSLAPAGAQFPAVCVALSRLGPEYAAEVRRLEYLFEELSEEVVTERPGRSSALDGLTRLLMISLLRLCPNSLKASPARHEDLRIFHRFNELIEAHYQQHWPLSRYAEGIGVTEARLNDVCRRIADLPSKRLIMERLIQEAKRLLLFTGGSANEICYQLGFKDPAYFSRFFQRHVQLTPGEYRQRQSGLR
ncbi:Virulence regulon transcriptional activator VirF [compost metagenome]